MVDSRRRAVNVERGWKSPKPGNDAAPSLIVFKNSSRRGCIGLMKLSLGQKLPEISLSLGRGFYPPSSMIISPCLDCELGLITRERRWYFFVVLVARNRSLMDHERLRRTWRLLRRLAETFLARYQTPNSNLYFAVGWSWSQGKYCRKYSVNW